MTELKHFDNNGKDASDHWLEGFPNQKPDQLYEYFHCGFLAALNADPWISVKDKLPKSEDNSVLVYFSETGSKETVHIQDYFDDITNGVDESGNQLYTKLYLGHNITHWMPLPDNPK